MDKTLYRQNSTGQAEASVMPEGQRAAQEGWTSMHDWTISEAGGACARLLSHCV